MGERQGSEGNSLRELEGFVDRLLEVAAGKGYHPTDFMRMRRAWGTCGAIERLMVSGTIQSGFYKLCKLGLKEHSLEAAVVRYPELFGREIAQAARWRLDQVKRGRGFA